MAENHSRLFSHGCICYTSGIKMSAEATLWGFSCLVLSPGPLGHWRDSLQRLDLNLHAFTKTLFSYIRMWEPCFWTICVYTGAKHQPQISFLECQASAFICYLVFVSWDRISQIPQILLSLSHQSHTYVPHTIFYVGSGNPAWVVILTEQAFTSQAITTVLFLMKQCFSV